MGSKHQSNKPKPNLSTEQCVDVVNAAHRNAKRLAMDSRMLFDEGSYATAMGLAVLAIEEHGKAMLMVQMALHRSEEQKTALWDKFYKHQPKVFGQLLLVHFKECKSVHDLEAAWTRATERVRYLDESLKQAAFYVGVDDLGGLSEPAKAFPKERVEQFIQGAELLTAKNDEAIPVEFIKLMEKHFAGTFDSAATPQDLQRVLSSIGPFLEEAQKFFPDKPKLVEGLIDGVLALASFVKSALTT